MPWLYGCGFLIEHKEYDNDLGCDRSEMMQVEKSKWFALDQCFSTWCPRVGSIKDTWGLVGKANSQAPAPTYWIRNSGARAYNKCALTNTPGVSGTLKVWEQLCWRGNRSHHTSEHWFFKSNLESSHQKGREMDDGQPTIYVKNTKESNKVRYNDTKLVFFVFKPSSQLFNLFSSWIQSLGRKEIVTVCRDFILFI